MNNKKTFNAYIDLLLKQGLAEQTAVFDEAAMEQTVEYVSYNSMDVKPGTLFICKGLNFKEEYLADAIARGAVMYVAERKFDVEGVPYILVNDMRRAMSEISAFYHDRVWNDGLQMIGITGTKGKSTTATFVKAIMDNYCQSQGKKEISFLSGIYTYDGARKVKAKKMTTPETLELHRHLAACVDNGCEYLVMETSSQALKYERTAALHYKVCGFLNVSEDHISDREHPTIEDYFQSKLMIFAQSETACINMEMEEKFLSRVLDAARSASCEISTFGRTPGADYYGYDVQSTPSSLTFKVDYQDGVDGDGQPVKKTEEILVSIGGFYNASNALAAIAMTRALGVPFENIKAGLANVKVAGRMELYTMPNKHVDVIVDYAHNKLSYQTLFENVKKLYPDRKILLVFGCHGNKAYNRRKDLGELADQYADKVVLTEQDPGTEDVIDICNQIKEHLNPEKVAATIVDRGEAIQYACELIDDNWVMVIAGNGADGYQKRGLKYIEVPTDGERVQMYIEANK